MKLERGAGLEVLALLLVRTAICRVAIRRIET
jgi:hypothetical protein